MPSRNPVGLHAEFNRLRLSHDEMIRRINDCEIQIAINATRLKSIEERILNSVSSAEFMPVKWTFYGSIGTALAAALTAVIASILAGALHMSLR